MQYRNDRRYDNRYTQGNLQQFYRGSQSGYGGYDFAAEQGILDPTHAEKYNTCRRLRRAVPKIVVGMSIAGLAAYILLGWPLIAIQSGIVLGGSGIYLVGLVGSIWHKTMGRRIQPGGEPNRMFNGSPMRPGIGEGVTFGLGAWHGRGRNCDSYQGRYQDGYYNRRDSRYDSDYDRYENCDDYGDYSRPRRSRRSRARRDFDDPRYNGYSDDFNDNQYRDSQRYYRDPQGSQSSQGYYREDSRNSREYQSDVHVDETSMFQ